MIWARPSVIPFALWIKPKFQLDKDHRRWWPIKWHFFSFCREGVAVRGGEGRCLEGGRIFGKKRSRIQWSGCGCKVTFTRLPFSPFFRSLKRIRGCRKGQKSFSLFVANILERLCCYWIRRGARAESAEQSSINNFLGERHCNSIKQQWEPACCIGRRMCVRGFSKRTSPVGSVFAGLPGIIHSNDSVCKLFSHSPYILVCVYQ